VQLCHLANSRMAAAAASAGSAWPPTTGPHRISHRLRPFVAKTVWEEFTPLAREVGGSSHARPPEQTLQRSTHAAVNLGQGFPDWPAPRFVKDAMIRAVEADDNQYARSAGHMPLVEALAKRYSAWLGRTVDPLTEVTVSVGATEALFALTQALLGPGDEAIVLEPSFDIYCSQITMAGATAVRVPLRLVDEGSTMDWRLDSAELEAAITDKTRFILLNTPHNPTGKVFSKEELELIAAVVRRHPDVLVICDEVYEHLTYDHHSHVRLASLPGMWEQVVTVSSSGKTFSVTGWKVGWVVGPAAVLRGVMTCNAWVQFSVPTPTQAAIAIALDEADKPYEGHASYYHWLKEQYQAKRDCLVASLTTAGMRPIPPNAGFFVMTLTDGLDPPASYLVESTPSCPVMTRDWALARFLTKEVRVACIPPSAFYSEEHKPLASNLLRFAFCKTNEALVEAGTRLASVPSKFGTA
jgi:kynurenine---oxoglutarate transaminase / cysteine-S-conjugate beta-lyase / glutamine---phenylpyruvate transaminase